MKYLFLIIGIVLFSNTLQAQSDRWVYIGNQEGRYQFYYDSTTITRTGNILKVWIKDEYKIEKIFNGKKVTKIMTYYKFDCEQRMMGPLDQNVYFEDGTRENMGEINDYYMIAPETVGEVIYNAVCRKPE